MGVEKFTAKLEEFFGKKLEAFKPLPQWKYEDYLGWHEQGDGKLFIGISVENGRVKNEGKFKLKEALKKVIEKYELPTRLTANHNIILYEIEPQWQEDISQIFVNHGIEINPENVNHLTRYSMACPALPTCGLATTESERILPSILERIDALLSKLNIAQENIVIRMTGCPNGCARPYMAELGFVGDSPNVYQIWLGGCPNQTRLARVYVDKLNIANLEKFLEPLLVFFRDNKEKSETFGDFCHRVGFDALRKFADKYKFSEKKVVKKGEKLPRKKRNEHRVSINEEWYQKLKITSTQQEKPMNQIVIEALESYFSK